MIRAVDRSVPSDGPIMVSCCTGPGREPPVWTRALSEDLMTAICLLRSGLVLLGLLTGCMCALAADIAAGKDTAEACAGCHGADGVSQMPLTPSLAGQPDVYVQWPLIYFRRGARKSEVMGPIAEALENEQIRNLGAYYASLPPPKPTPSADPDEMAQDGEKVAVFHRCRSCHGEGFVGFGAAARLADQREDVLLKALRDFKSGARVASGIASMTDVVYGLNDNAMRALAHYLATRP
jgi:cytochrome c553